MSFTELGLSPKVIAAIAASGYTSPTPIQAQAIPFAVSGRDVLGIAQTGTGKTAGFVLPMLTRLEQGRARARMPRSLILCPTRELAAQVAENFERYGVNHKLSVALLIGGVSFDDQNRKLDRGVDVLIATPGRLLDHFQRGKLLLSAVEILVIDEADRMLDMGFIPDIERICSLLPVKRQTLFFSATMPPEIQRLVDRFLKDPHRIEIAPEAKAASTITQRFKFVGHEAWEKREALRDLIRSSDVKNAIIFCNRKRDVDVLHKSLVKHGFNAGCLHGDMDQHTRTATLDAFRNGSITLLAASDVAARGLDIPEVSHVFNFDVPIQAEDYVHRIGRTGRAGRSGHSATLVTDDDMRTLGEIGKLINKEPEWIGEPPPPDAGTRRRPRLRRGGPSLKPVSRERVRHGARPERTRHRHEEEAVAADSTSRPARVADEPRLRRETASAEPAPRPRREPLPADPSPRPRRERRPEPAQPQSRTSPAIQPWDEGPRESGRQQRRGASQRRNEGRDRGERKGDDAVIGLGDHMPDFLKRPVKHPSR